MGMLLAADDISAGDYVAVHSPEPRVIRNLRGMHGEVPICQHVMPVTPGVPMRVLEVSLPFVACSLVEPGGCESGPAIIDLRLVRLCRINNDFVEAIRSFSTNDDDETPGPYSNLP